MKIWSDSWINGERIPPKYAAGKLQPGASGVTFSVGARCAARGPLASTPLTSGRRANVSILGFGGRTLRPG